MQGQVVPFEHETTMIYLDGNGEAGHRGHVDATMEALVYPVTVTSLA